MQHIDDIVNETDNNDVMIRTLRTKLKQTEHDKCVFHTRRSYRRATKLGILMQLDDTFLASVYTQLRTYPTVSKIDEDDAHVYWKQQSLVALCELATASECTRRDDLIGRVIDKMRLLHRTNDTKFTQYFFNTALTNNFIQQHVLARYKNEMEIEQCSYTFETFLIAVIAHGRENLFRRLIYENYAKFIRVLKCMITDYTDIRKSCRESPNVHDRFFSALRVARSHGWAFTFDAYNEYFDEMLLFQTEAYTLSIIDMLYPLGFFNPHQVAHVIRTGERFLNDDYHDKDHGQTYCVRQYGRRGSREIVSERLAIFVDIVSEKTFTSTLPPKSV